jgi:nucleoside-diphosphate-sugar epimerase
MINMQKQTIGIFGSTGHISQNLISYFYKNNYGKLILFSRNKSKLKNIFKKYDKNNFIYETYSNFPKYTFDVIINCIGEANPASNYSAKYFDDVNYYDDKIIYYIQKYPKTLYLNFSSGIVYGKDFTNPVTDKRNTLLDLDEFHSDDFYAFSKIYSELKHRTYPDLNIIDLRIFSFFSRHIDLKYKFLITELINSIKNNTIFYTDDNDIVRDYIHPFDLYSIVTNCIDKKDSNVAIDVKSKKPISKFQLLDYLKKQYNLKFEIKNKNFLSTELKTNYFSKSKKLHKLLNFTPKFSSLDSFKDELDFLL